MRVKILKVRTHARAVSYLIGSAGTRHRKEKPVNTSRPAAFAIRRKCALVFVLNNWEVTNDKTPIFN
jgi:hypothetical protein